MITQDHGRPASRADNHPMPSPTVTDQSAHTPTTHRSSSKTRETGPLSPARHRAPACGAHLRRVPDPRSRRGRWVPPGSACLLICAGAASFPGARTVTEIAGVGGQRATTTVLGNTSASAATCPDAGAPLSHATLTRLLAALDGDALDGDALDAAIGAYLAGHDHTGVERHRPRRRGRRSRWTARRCPAPRTASSATGTCCPPSPTPPP